MTTYDHYQQQHQEILGLVTDVLSALQADKVRMEPETVLVQMQRLSEALRLHLLQEDQLLYPALLRHPDARVRETAQRYMDSMGNLRQVFLAHVERWNGAEKLSRDPDTFIKETRSVFDALAKRMLSEETGLYPLVRQPRA